MPQGRGRRVRIRPKATVERRHAQKMRPHRWTAAVISPDNPDWEKYQNAIYALPPTEMNKREINALYRVADMLSRLDLPANAAFTVDQFGRAVEEFEQASNALHNLALKVIGFSDYSGGGRADYA